LNAFMVIVVQYIYNILQCIWVYLNIFECFYSIFESLYNMLNVFECTYSIFMVYFNVFINIMNGISLSHSHCNVFTKRTHVYIWFSLSTMTPFPTCYTTTLYSPISIYLFQLSYNLWIKYISILTFHVYTSPHILHSMSSLVAEPKFFKED
jgi:hypothetical protein